MSYLIKIIKPYADYRASYQGYLDYHASLYQEHFSGNPLIPASFQDWVLNIRDVRRQNDIWVFFIQRFYFTAGEVCLPSPDSPADVQGAATNSQDSIEQPTPEGFMQTLLDGVYDVATQISLPFKKPKQVKKTPTSAPVQLTLFQLLQPYAIEQFNKMQALAQAYLKDSAELKNPQSRLFKMLGAKAQKRLAELEDKLVVLRIEISQHFLCWELPMSLWVVV